MDEALRSGLLGGQRFELPNRLVEFPLLRHPPRFGNRRLLRYRLLRLRSFDLLLRLRFSPRLCSAKSDGSEHRRLSEDRPKQRSEERRVGKGGRSRWALYQEQNKERVYE